MAAILDLPQLPVELVEHFLLFIKHALGGALLCAQSFTALAQFLLLTAAGVGALLQGRLVGGAGGLLGERQWWADKRQWRADKKDKQKGG